MIDTPEAIVLKHQEKIHPEGRQKYFKQFDGLRCLAVLAVMFSHYLTYRAIVLIPLGSMGVNLFFVLSGFLITRILLLSKESVNGMSTFSKIKQFYIRRTLRIFPIYYLTILVLFILKFPAVKENIVWLITYTFNIKFSLPNVWESNQLGALVHLWSLSVEEQFYLFFPILIFLIPNKRLKIFFQAMIFVAVLSRLTLLVFNAPSNSLYVLTPCCFDSFAIGALLAYYILYEYEKLQSILNRNLLFALAVMVFILDIIYSRNLIVGYGECRTVLERFFFSIVCFWIVGKAAINNFSGYFKLFIESRFAIYIGKISYGLYIYHQFTRTYFNNVLFRFNKDFLNYSEEHMLVRAFLLFLVTVLFATFSWYVIERPFINLKGKIK